MTTVELHHVADGPVDGSVVLMGGSLGAAHAETKPGPLPAIKARTKHRSPR